MELNFAGIKTRDWFVWKGNDNEEFNLICLPLSWDSPLTVLEEDVNVASNSVIQNDSKGLERDRQREIEMQRPGNVMTLLKIVLLANWRVSAVFQDFSLQVRLSACLPVCCFIVVLLSMLDVQLHLDSPNDNAAG